MTTGGTVSQPAARGAHRHRAAAKPRRTRRSAVALLAYWALVLLVAVGSWLTSRWLVPFAIDHPKPAAASIAAFAALGLAIGWLIRRIGYLQRGPAWLIVAALAWGGLVAAPLTPATTDAIASATAAESLNLLGLVLIVLIARHRITGLLDGFVYGSFTGLGFQLADNLLAASDAYPTGTASDLEPARDIITTNIADALWSQALFTAVAGIGLAYLLTRTTRPRWRRAAVALAALALAWAMHAMWTSSLGDEYGSVPLGLALLAVCGLVIGMAVQAEAPLYADALAALEEPALATSEEIRTVVSRRRRIEARLTTLVRQGPRSARSVRRLQRAQSWLAAEIRVGQGWQVDGRAAQVRDERRRIAQRHDAFAT